MTQDELDKRFNYHPPKDRNVSSRHEEVRQVFKTCVDDLRWVLIEESRETSLAWTKLEEAMFWANAHVARNT